MIDVNPSADCDRPRFDAARLTRFTAAVFERAGLAAEAAAISAEVLVAADLHGIESHGLPRLPWYLEMIAAGAIDVDATPVIEQETAATMVIDARNGFGPPAAAWAMRYCLDKALETGVAFVTVRNSNHFGIAGYYAMMGLDRGLAGIAMTNASPQIVPLFGSRAGSDSRSR